MKPCLRFRGFEISAGFLQIENNFFFLQKKFSNHASNPVHRSLGTGFQQIKEKMNK